MYRLDCSRRVLFLIAAMADGDLIVPRKWQRSSPDWAPRREKTPLPAKDDDRTQTSASVGAAINSARRADGTRTDLNFFGSDAIIPFQKLEHNRRRNRRSRRTVIPQGFPAVSWIEVDWVAQCLNVELTSAMRRATCLLRALLKFTYKEAVAVLWHSALICVDLIQRGQLAGTDWRHFACALFQSSAYYGGDVTFTFRYWAKAMAIAIEEQDTVLWMMRCRGWVVKIDGFEWQAQWAWSS